MMMSPQQVPPRQEIAHEDLWNWESVYPSIEAWEAELKAIQAALPSLSQYQGRLAQAASLLADALQVRDSLFSRQSTASMFATIHSETDRLNPAASSMPGKAQAVWGQLLAAASYIEPELLEIGQERLEEWITAEARLGPYRQTLEDLFRKQAHVRSAEVEELLGMLADPFSSIATTASMLTDADFKFAPAHDRQGAEVAVNQGSIHKILASPDREARRSAWESYADQHLAFENTLASNLAASIKANVFNSRARRHANSLEASLFENNIPPAVFYNLIETFRKNLPTWQRYFKVRAKALGLSDLQVYDMWAPLSGQRPAVPFEQAVAWICDGLAPLGKDYVETVRRGCLQERWVDRYPNQGKTSGAFSYGAQGTHPFIVMSYTDEIFSLSTLAHELGHSMHSYLTWKNQPFIYTGYSLFVAEVASNFHQAMVRAHLLEQNPSPAFQIALIEEAMANFYRYFFIMPLLALFELETHQRAERGEALGAQSMNELMADLFQEAYGEAVKIDRARYGITWATFGHLYADYYVYQYATGISGAHALSHRILAGVPGAAGDYLKFLSTGSALYPLDALKLAGVDMTTPQAVEETFAVLAGYVERLETLVG
jgi:oligoendopeptidase F